MAAIAKLLIIAFTLAGLFVQAWLGSREWAPLLYLTIGALVAGFLSVRWQPVWGWLPILITAYIYPAIYHATREFFTFSYYGIFLAGLLGGALASAHPARWSLPPAWRLPLAFWALVLAAGWPVLAFREMNFIATSIGEFTLANSGLGGPPPVIIVTMLVSVLPQVIGILWFDAMFAAFARDDASRFRRAILLPLSAGLIVSCALAIYQWAVDIEFLSSHQWPFYKRAAGGLLDGNASGQLFGLWSAAALTWGLAGGWLQILAGIAVSALAWLALWGTGSRMALLAALVGISLAVYAAVRGGRGRIGTGKLIAGVGGVAGLVIVLGVVARFETDPVSRTIASLPRHDRESIEKFVEFEFWNRFGPFGTGSLRMIRDSPLLGVGAGTFEPIYVDYAYVVTNGRTRSHFDNAQNWFRHQLAELGLLGGLGWMIWSAMFAAFVWRTAPAREGLTEATGVKAAIVSLVLMSLISMPSRNIFVALSFWVFAFWLVKLGGEITGPRWLVAAEQRRTVWLAVILAAFAFVSATGWYGYRHLRPPHRAMMANWDYLNGVSRPVQTADGIVRYTTQHQGVAVFYAVPGAYLRLVFQIVHDDRAPVRIKIYQGDAQVAHFVVSDRQWQELYIKVPEGMPDRMMLQASVDRLAPRRDTPARGLILKDWAFVAQPPPGAMIATSPIAAR
ncbi:MAG: O-antigen ligase family protein [Acidobacteriota bacterium]|nr:O-antigen ligase family protein [Acidobacteriota bacterium]